jgi:hypothetical protein
MVVTSVFGGRPFYFASYRYQTRHLADLYLPANQCCSLKRCGTDLTHPDDNCTVWNNGAIFLLLDREKSEAKLAFEMI